MSVTRDLWIVLRARDEASRIINSFGRNLGRAASNSASQLTPFEQSLRNISMRLDQFGRSATLAGAAMVGLGIAGAAMIKSAIDVAAEYDRQSRRTLTQIDNITASLKDVADIGRRVAKDIGIPFESLQDTLYFIFSSIDVNLGQAEDLLRKFSQEAIAGATSVDKAARTSIAIMNSLGYSIQDLSRLQDIQFQIVRKGIISYEELADTIGRALPATARAGQNFETVGAMMAFLTRNGLSAAMAASSAARALEGFANPKVVARLEDMGVQVRDLKGNFLPLLDVMEQMNKKIGHLAAPERAKVLQELFAGAGGTIQARRFWDLAFKNFDDFQAMIGYMQNSTGVFQNAYEVMAGSVATQSELLRNKWMLMKEAIGRALLPQVLKFIKVLSKLLDWFDRLPEPTKNMIAQILVLGTVLTLVGGALLIFIGTIAMMASWIITGGAALAAMLGIMAALVIQVVLFVAAMNAAYRSSEAFRNILSDLHKNFEDVKKIFISFARDVAKSFDTYLRPALKEFWDYVNSNILPLIHRFATAWRETLMPKLQEAANFVSKVVKVAFMVLAKVISNYLIPAIDYLVNWWETHKKVIEPMLPLLAQVVKWMLIIGAVILLLPLFAFVTLVAMITSVLIVVGTLIAALTKLWNWLVKAHNATHKFFVDLWNRIKDIGASIGGFFVGVWKKVVDGVKGAGKLLGDVIDGILNALYKGIWEPWWNLWGGLVKEIWGLITDIFRFFTVLISEIIKDWIMPLIALFMYGWNYIKNLAIDAWNYMVEHISSAIGKIIAGLVYAWNYITDITATVWNKIKEVISSIVNFIKDKIIQPVLDGIVYLWNKYMKGFADSAGSGFKKAYDTIKGWIDFLFNLFSNAENWLFNAGKNIIKGLIDGITDGVHWLREQLKKITEDIPKWKGPASFDLRLLTPTGRNIMIGLSRGIAERVPFLKRQLQDISTQIGGAMPAPNLAYPATAMPRSEGQTTNNQYITINTQEINPRAHATELGWILQNRL